MKSYELKSERVARLREEALGKTPGVCVERARYLTKAYKENEEKSKYIKRALAVKEVLENMSIYMKDGELVVGNQSSDNRTAPLFPEYAVEWIIEELNEKGNFDQRDGDRFHLQEKDKKEVLEICEYWKGKTLREKCYSQMTDEMKNASQVKAIHGEGNMTSGDGHIVPDFEKALKVGLRGIINEAKEEMEKVDITEFGGYNKKDFLESIVILNEAIIDFSHRFSKLAKEAAEKETDEERKKELLVIAENCKNVPENSPSTF